MQPNTKNVRQQNNHINLPVDFDSVSHLGRNRKKEIYNKTTKHVSGYSVEICSVY